MSPFEADSLRVAHEMLVAAQWQTVAAVATMVITGVAAVIGLRTLKELVQQVKLGADANSIAQLNALLMLEQDMSQRRVRLAETLLQMQTIQKSKAYQFDPTILEPSITQFDEARESYLNSLDRLCFCVIRNKFSDDELRADYRDVVKTAIKDHHDHFGPATPFRNILKLHERWAET